MSDPLCPCPNCYRHVRASSTSCPFCGDARRVDGVAWGRVGTGVILAVAASAALHACYGAPAPCPIDQCDYDRDAQTDSGADASTDVAGDR